MKRTTTKDATGRRTRRTKRRRRRRRMKRVMMRMVKAMTEKKRRRELVAGDHLDRHKKYIVHQMDRSNCE